MYPTVLAFNLQEFASKFGLHTDAFIAHAIAFTLLIIVVAKFGIKPIAAQLEERRQRIEEGERRRAESERALAEVKQSSAAIIDEAREQGQEDLAHAKAQATQVQEQAAERAAADAQQTIENARKQAELETRQQQEALKGDFARLLAQATAQVTGKVLTEADHRSINEQAISKL